MLAQIYSTRLILKKHLFNFIILSSYCCLICSLCIIVILFYSFCSLFFCFFHIYSVSSYSLWPITEIAIWHGRLVIHEIKWRQIDLNLNYIHICGILQGSQGQFRGANLTDQRCFVISCQYAIRHPSKWPMYGRLLHSSTEIVPQYLRTANIMSPTVSQIADSAVYPLINAFVIAQKMNIIIICLRIKFILLSMCLAGDCLFKVVAEAAEA